MIDGEENTRIFAREQKLCPSKTSVEVLRGQGHQ